MTCSDALATQESAAVSASETNRILLDCCLLVAKYHLANRVKEHSNLRTGVFIRAEIAHCDRVRVGKPN